MKVWQLTSYCRQYPDVLHQHLEDRAWQVEQQIFEAASHESHTGWRENLDSELSDEFCRAVLANIPYQYVIKNNELCRAELVGDGQLRLSAVEAFTQFGGQILEEIEEHGCVSIRQSPAITVADDDAVAV